MNILEAALALAISMLFFSVIVTTIVETLHRIFGVREKGLEIMLGEVYDAIVEPQVKPSSAGDATDHSDDEQRKAFVTDLARNRIGSTANTSWVGRKALVRPDKLAALSTVQFIQRLAGTEAGKSLHNKALLSGKRTLDRTITNIARRYEDIGADASEYFGSRTKLVSIVISMFLAFAINIDALQLFKAYLTDNELRTTVIEQSQQIQDEYARQRATYGDAALDQEENIAALKVASEQVRTDIESIKTSGVPIGWSHFPYCSGDAMLARCGSGDGSSGKPAGKSAYFVWFLGVVLGGILVGLGGPFWFDAIRNLSLVLSIARTGSGGQQARDKQAEIRGIKPESVAEAFATATGSLIGKKGKRALLQSNGATVSTGGTSS